MQCRVPFCTFVCHDGSQPNVPNVNTLFSCFSFVVVYVCVRSFSFANFYLYPFAFRF